MLQELEKRLLKAWKTLSNFKLRQHMIYLVFAILIGVLMNGGAWYLIFIFLVYLRRFPKTYWIYFLIFLISFSYYHTLEHQTKLHTNASLEPTEALVVKIKKQSREKQTAILEIGSERIYWTTSSVEPKLMPGDIVLVNGELNVPMAATVPNGFDFKQYLSHQKVYLTLYTNEFELIGHQFTIRQWQYELAQQIEMNFPPLTGAYMKAWLLGMTDDLEEEIQTLYSELGIIHLFAISGLHVGLLSFLLRFVLKRLGVIEELSQLIVIVALVLFMVISGGSPSIVRASGMSILLMINKRLRLNLSSLDVFSILFLVNVCLNPRQIYQLGFIYSYWMTFILICFQPTFQKLGTKSLFFFLPFIAQCASAPIQLYFYDEINVLSYLVNLWVIPLVSLCLLPLLILTILIPFIAPLTNHLLMLFESVIVGSASLFTWNWIVGEFSLNLLLGLLLLFLGNGYVFEKKRCFSNYAISIILVIFLLESHRFFVSESQFTMLDVGQGDSVIIQSSYRRCSVVVDTGGTYQFTGKPKPIFSTTLEPFLKGEGIRTIDYLILTHGDFDHVGEAVSLLQTFEVKEVLTNGQPLNELMKEIEEVAKEVGTIFRQVKQEEVLTCGNQILTFLQSNQIKSDGNAASLVFTLEMDGFSALLTGDMGVSEEAEILSRYQLNQLTVYKAAHHGSKTSNSNSFLRRLSPMITLVSSGRKNRYGHPSVELIENLKQLEIPLLNTQYDGSIQFKIRRDRLSIQSFPPYVYNVQ